MIRLLANPWVLGILGALLVAAIGGAYMVGRHHEANAQAAKLLKASQRATKAEQSLRDLSREIEIDDRVKADALDQRFVLQLSAPRPIRMCEPAPPSPAADAGTAGAGDGAGDRGHVLSAGPDIGPSLLVYGRDCERIRQKLTALQAWAALVSGAQPAGSSRF